MGSKVGHPGVDGKSMREAGGSFPRITGLILAALLFLAPSSVRGDVCGNGGGDGTLVVPPGGVVNTYFPPNANGFIDLNNTTIALGTSTGAATTLHFGDLLLIIQMQDAQINSLDDNRYGDGVQEVSPTPDAGRGSQFISSSGLYEYVVVDNGVTPFTPPTPVPSLLAVPIKGTGPNGTLINTYTNAASTASRGQRRYQVIRVPQYTSATLTSVLTAGPWNGTTGGVLAMDVRDNLILGNATVSVMGLGFRAGLGEKLSSGTAVPNTTY